MRLTPFLAPTRPAESQVEEEREQDETTTALETVRAPTRDSARIAPELAEILDERTRALLERRRGSKVRRRGWLVRRMLLLADVVGLIAAFAVADLFAGPQAPGHIASPLETVVFLLTLPLWVIAAKLSGLYDHDEERSDQSLSADTVRVFRLVTVGTWLIFTATRLTGLADPDVVRLALFWAAAIVAISLARLGARAFCRRHFSYLQNTVIVGMGEVGRLVAEKLSRHPEYGVNLVGYVDDCPDGPASTSGLAYLGTPDDLPALVPLLGVERVMFDSPEKTVAGRLDLIRELSATNVQVDIVPRYFEVIGPSLSIHTIEGLPVIGLPAPRLSRSSGLLKRSMDLAFSLLGILLLSPLLVAAALAIRLDSKGPTFFRQERVGAGGTPFRVWKFRTMSPGADDLKAALAPLSRHATNGGDPRMFKIPDDPRVTRVGRYLRSYSIDELPQLLNVVTGHMSLVGPRPLIPEEDQFVDGWARKRLDLKPGITGLWQVLGSSRISFAEMVRLDYQYVTGWSLGRDLGLILRTVPVVLRGANRG